MQNEELRRTQLELEAARARYFDLYDLAPVGYVTLSDKGIILETNLTLVDLLGVKRKQVVKRPLTRFIFPARPGHLLPPPPPAFCHRRAPNLRTALVTRHRRLLLGAVGIGDRAAK
jgi:PAS domain-containing protein